MSLIRPRQRAITAVSPHNANSKYLIPKRTGGYRPLAWSTIPGQQFYTGIPAQVDFRAWLSGTNRQSATITEGDVYPAGFTFNNGVLSWDGTGNPSPGFEQSCIASDGEGPDTESGLFTVSVVDYTALAWSGPLTWQPIQNGTPQQFDVRAELSGTNAATAVIREETGVPVTLPVWPGYTWDGSILTYDGVSEWDGTLYVEASDNIGPDASTSLVVSIVFDVTLVPQSFSINDKNGTLDSRDPFYSSLAGDLSLQSSYIVNDSGIRDFEITRVNGASGAVAVTVTVSGPNAGDFTPQTATVNFADGQITANFTSTIGDLVADGSATITLSNPTNGAGLGNASAPVTIRMDAAYGHGDLYQIVGSGFGSRPDYNSSNYTWQGHRHIHFRFTNFEEGPINDLGNNAEWLAKTKGFGLSSSYVGDGRLRIVAGGPNPSGHYLERREQAGGTFPRLGGLSVTLTGPNGGNIYTAFKFRTATPPSGGGKPFRIYWEYPVTNTDNVYWGTAANQANIEFVREGRYPALYGRNTPSLSSWRRIAHFWDAPDRSRTVIDGTLAIFGRSTVPDSGFWDFYDSDEGNAARLDIPNMIDAQGVSSAGETYDYAELVVDYTFARVEMRQGNVVEFQPVISWANDRIDVAINKGSLSAGTATLTVFDNTDSVIHSEQVTVN